MVRYSAAHFQSKELISHSTGDSNQICGGNGIGDAGGSYMSLFADRSRFDGNTTSISTSAPTGPFVNPGVNGYNSIGCYTEGTNGRALPVGKTTTDTVASCIDACGSGSYTYAGIEYGGKIFLTSSQKLLWWFLQYIRRSMR